MNKVRTQNQLADILARERKKLGLDKSLSDEQVVYKKVEELGKAVVKQGRYLLNEIMTAKREYVSGQMKDHMQKQLAHGLNESFSKEEVVFLLSVALAEELIVNVETT